MTNKRELRKKSRKAQTTAKYWTRRARNLTKQGRQRKRVRLFSIIASFMLIGLVTAIIGGAAVLAYFSKDLPSPDKLTEREIPQTTKIFSRQGDVLYEIFDDEKRTYVPIDDLPEYLIHATVAIEDSEFYTHSGFDINGILRSAFRIASEGEIRGGGSTITQQLVKNVFLSTEQTFTRKFKELILSLQLEAKYSKDEILQMYLNEVAYGGNYYGIGAASEGYFGKAARDLTLEEAVFLAGLPQAPSLYSPRSGDPELALARYEQVLSRMVIEGYLSEDEKAEALEIDVLSRVRSTDNNIQAPHFVFYVRQELVKQFGEKVIEQGGLRVTTTLDMGKQRIAEEEIKYQLERLAQQNANASNQALVSVDPRNGEVLAMVGSADYFDESIDGNVNVILAKRQPGSAMKPIVFMKGFQMGYTAASFLPDILACFGATPEGDYCPSNSDGRYWGPILAREALANSRNTPAVRMAQLVGVDNIITQAEELGVTTLTDRDRYGLSIALGAAEVKPIELVNAYAAFANKGEQYDLTSILKVEDKDGQVIFENKEDERKAKSVVPAEHAYVLTDILSDNVTRQRLFGVNNLLEIGRPAAVKTGTTNDNKDAWTCGYVPQLTTCVWTGNTDNTPMAQTIQGSTGATPTFHHYMKRVLENEAIEEFERPSDVVKVVVDALSGKLPQDGKDFPTRHEVFVKGTEPTEIDDFHTVVDVCKSKGLLATDYHRLIDDVESKTFTYLKEINPGLQHYTDKWMDGRDGYGKPPEEECPIVDEEGNSLDGPYLDIAEPQNGATVDGTEIRLTLEAFSDDRILKIEVYWEDTLIKTLTSSPYQVTFEVAEGLEGEREIRVVGYDGRGDQTERSVTVEFPTKEKPTPTPTQEDVVKDTN